MTTIVMRTHMLMMSLEMLRAMAMATLIKWAMKLRWYDKTLVYIELGPSGSYFGWPLLLWSSQYVHIISFKLFREHFTVFLGMKDRAAFWRVQASERWSTLLISLKQ